MKELKCNRFIGTRFQFRILNNKKLNHSIYSIASKIGVLVLLFMFCSNTVSAIEFYHRIKKEGTISKNGLVELSNTRGKIDIETWDENRVSVEIVITVNARNQTDANSVIERISIVYTNYNDKITAETQIHELPRWNWNHVRSEYTVDYNIKMPKTANLNLFNKFGDAWIGDLKGKANLSIQHGNIRLKNVENQLTLNLQYGNCTVREVSDSDITMIHGKIKMKKATNINFVTSYSKVNIDRADEIKSQSINDTYKLGIIKEFRNQGKYDNIEIQQVQNIVVVSKFSDFEIGLLERRGDIDIAHGTVVIDEVSQSFADIRLVGERTNFQLAVAKGTDYKMDATAQYANVQYPKKCNVVCEDKKGEEKTVAFYVGKKQNPFSYIKAKVKYGDINVK